MLSRGAKRWIASVTPEEVAPYFHEYFMSATYRKKIDFSARNTKAMWDYNEQKVAKLVAEMPMTKWTNSSKGMISYDGETFALTFDVEEEHLKKLHGWTKEVCEYRLHRYFERRG